MKLNPFWIVVKTNHLAEGFTDWHAEDISYIGPGYNPDKDINLYEDGFSLSTWFYSTLKKFKTLERTDEPFTFTIEVFPADKFHYCGEEGVPREKDSYQCPAGCVNRKK